MSAAPPARQVVSFAHMSPGARYDGRRLAFGEVTRTWAWGGSSGQGVRVCIIDSGLRADWVPERVDARLTVSKGVNPGGRISHEVVPDSEGDAANHGSDCAEIIHRLAPDAQITSIRVLGSSLGGTSDVLTAALAWAVDQRFDVINLSLSTKNPAFKESLHDLADQAAFHDVAIVAAAHNNPVDSFPWRFASVFSTGSHDHPEPEYLEVNPRPPVEFFAHGVRVSVQRGDGFARVSGNSFAAPHVSGLVARIRGKHPHLSVGEVKRVLAMVSDNFDAAIDHPEPAVAQPQEGA